MTRVLPLPSPVASEEFLTAAGGPGANRPRTACGHDLRAGERYLRITLVSSLEAVRICSWCVLCLQSGGLEVIEP